MFSRHLDSAPDQGRSILPCPHDLRVAAQAKQRLCRSPFPALHAVRCECREGILTLSGSVASPYLKELAVWLVTPLEGVNECTNRLEVHREVLAG